MDTISKNGKRALLTTREAAQYLALDADTLKNWRSLRKGPPFVRYKRFVRYIRDDLDRWVDEHCVNPAKILPAHAGRRTLRGSVASL